jgi:hypothetical protein
MYIVSPEKTPKVNMTLDVLTDSIAGIEVWFVGDSRLQVAVQLLQVIL